jgi:hypothetical protein
MSRPGTTVQKAVPPEPPTTARPRASHRLRPFVIELQRSNARSTAVLLLLIGGIGLGAGYGTWRGQLLPFAYFQSTMVFLLMPLALATGAGLGRRESATRAAEVMSSTGRPPWQKSLPVLTALALAVAAAHLVLFGIGVAVIGATGGYLSLSALAILAVDVVVLVGAACLGVAAGRSWPSRTLPPLLAAAVLVVQVGVQSFNGSSNRLQFLSLMHPYPPRMPGDTFTNSVLLSRLSLGIGLLVAALLLVSARSWAMRASAAAAGLLGATGLLLIPTPGPAGAWRVQPDAQRLVCAEGSPQVCVSAVHRSSLDHVTAPARRGLAALAQLPGAPTRAEEQRLTSPEENLFDAQYTARPERTDTVYFVLENDSEAILVPDVTESVVLGAGTAYVGCGAPNLVAKGIAGAWLLGTGGLSVGAVVDGSFRGQASSSWTGAGPDSAEGRIRQGVIDLRRLPEAEQLARVTALRAAALRCEPDLMAVLTGVKAP